MLSHHDSKKLTTMSQTSFVTFCSLMALSLPIGLFSLILTIVTLCLGLVTSWGINHIHLSLTMFYLAAFIMGLIDMYYALRIEFDKRLFKYLATCKAPLANTLIELDNALVAFHLISSKQLAIRSIAERQQGTLLLFKKQLFILIMQIMLLLVAWLSGIIQSY